VTALNNVLLPTLGSPTIPALNIHFPSSRRLAFETGCHHVDVQFNEELARILPPDIPHRERLIEKAAQHLALIVSVNEYMNLTRITDPQQAAIKHIYDSVAPWHHFRGVKKVLDAGTGAGFPGIPLSLVLPDVRFTLSESVHKKARFVDSVVESLELPNVHVVAQRAEERAASRHPDIITARAMAPIPRIIDLFGKALKEGARLILYKGPDVEAELEKVQKRHLAADVLCRYELPHGLGRRTLVQIQRQRPARTAS
jgi:16S rRNA (guanine527-N7)-methyltransferase